MKTIRIPKNQYILWRISGVGFGILMLIIGTMSTLLLPAGSVRDFSYYYNVIKSILLALALVVPYSKVTGKLKPILGYGIPVLFAYQVIFSGLPALFSGFNAIGILAFLFVCLILIPNGIIAYQILVQDMRRDV